LQHADAEVIVERAAAAGNEIPGNSVSRLF
jgi:hypothetical protein